MQTRVETTQMGLEPQYPGLRRDSSGNSKILYCSSRIFECENGTQISGFFHFMGKQYLLSQYTVNPPVLNLQGWLFILEGGKSYGLGMKRRAKRKRYVPEYRRSTAPPAPLEPAVCTRSEKCAGCPFPSSGFICWGMDEDCMRTRMEKLQNKEERTK